MRFKLILDPDTGSKTTSKWKSAWDLTERQKEKLDQQKDGEERLKKRKKKKKSFISQGFLDLITIGDPAVSSDNRHLKSFASNLNNKSNISNNSANNSTNKVSDYILTIYIVVVYNFSFLEILTFV